MHLHGIVQAATLEEFPPGSDQVEMVLRVQGVGAGQPRKIIVPFNLLLREPDLDPDTIAGHAFQAEVAQDGPNRWVVEAIGFAGNRVLRSGE
jgi:hypothetical protein